MKLLLLYLQLSYFWLLMLKYCVGWMDVLTLPVFVIITDSNIRYKLISERKKRDTLTDRGTGTGYFKQN